MCVLYCFLVQSHKSQLCCSYFLRLHQVVALSTNYGYHKKSFKVPLYQHDTKLYTILELKTKQLNPHIFWKIKGMCKSYNPISKRCNLCVSDKLEIIGKPNLLNKGLEINSQCRHKNKHRLQTLASNLMLGDIT